MAQAAPLQNQHTPNSTEYVRQIRQHDHACFIYEKDSEVLQAASAFLGAGYDEGAKCLYITSDKPVAECRDAFNKAGIPVQQGEQDGRFAVLTKSQAYLRTGSFDPDEMVYFLEEAVRAEKGRPVRGCGDMGWALAADMYLPKLILYESKVNQVFARQPFAALCFYDKRRFPAHVLNEIVRVHPYVLYGGRAMRNNFYVPPAAYLTGGKDEAILNHTLNDLIAHSQTQPDIHANALTMTDLKAAGS